MDADERNLVNSDVSAHCRNYETALINCLFVLIIFVCRTVVFICVFSIARAGC